MTPNPIANWMKGLARSKRRGLNTECPYEAEHMLLQRRNHDAA